MRTQSADPACVPAPTLPVQRRPAGNGTAAPSTAVPDSERPYSERPDSERPDSRAPAPAPTTPTPPATALPTTDVPISGRWAGTGPNGDRIDLRVELVATSVSTAPVLKIVSADHWHPADAATARSWVVDDPEVRWNRRSVRISGTARFWSGSASPTAVVVSIRRTKSGVGTATVTLTGADGPAVHRCRRIDSSYRGVELEVDRVTSVPPEPLRPCYPLRSHPHRPADLPDDAVTLETAFAAAGINLTWGAGGSTVDDSDPAFTSWSPGELHDAMETAFSRWGDSWPNWRLWGLLAGRFDNPGVGGLMFDAATVHGGAGRAPERQGFAVFRDHPWFDDLVPGAPTRQDQARAARQYLYTWVHEAGHAFSLQHSWDKDRPNALSWMNYDWKYDQTQGAQAFWSRFRFSFDDAELRHLRHGNRSEVIMGGAPWAAGGHLESPRPGIGALAGEAPGPVELSVRVDPAVDFLAPVRVELRLRNLTDRPVTVDARLDPVAGTTSVRLRTPSGTVLSADPVMCQLGVPEELTLAPAGTTDGSDRVSRLVDLTFGRGGFLFATPGSYEISAVHHSFGQVAVSAAVPLRVRRPVDRRQETFAADWFSPAVGLTQALGGSMSPFLRGGLHLLEEAADRYPGTGAGTGAARTLARCVGRDFYRREPVAGAEQLLRHHTADPTGALALTAPALAALTASNRRSANLPQRDLVCLRTRLHLAHGDPQLAATELNDLAVDLARRGAKPSVVQSVRRRSATLGEG